MSSILGSSTAIARSIPGSVETEFNTVPVKLDTVLILQMRDVKRPLKLRSNCVNLEGVNHVLGGLRRGNLVDRCQPSKGFLDVALLHGVADVLDGVAVWAEGD